MSRCQAPPPDNGGFHYCFHEECAQVEARNKRTPEEVLAEIREMSQKIHDTMGLHLIRVADGHGTRTMSVPKQP